MTNSAPTFECSVCFGDKNEENPLLIDSSPVCSDCVKSDIVPQFESALQHEHNYPPKWGADPLQIQDFAAYFTKDFMTRYQRRELEYASRHRVYCKHKTLPNILPPTGGSAPGSALLTLSRRQIERYQQLNWLMVDCGAMVSGREHRKAVLLRCYHCNSQTCRRCGTAMYFKEPTKHECIPLDSRTPDEILQGQERARDYQKCPTCDHIMSLWDGCNAIRCTQCNTDLCYLCGAVAGHDSNHWQDINSCPRFGRRGDDNAVFDARNDADAGNTLQRLINEIVQRGEAHIAAGNQIDMAFLDASLRDMAGIGWEMAMPEQPDPDQVWNALVELRGQLVEDAAFLPLVQEIARFGARQDAAFDNPRIVELVGIARMALAALPQHANLVRRGHVPPAGAERQIWMQPHNFIRHVLSTWPEDVVEREMPLLHILLQFYLDQAPEWLEAELGPVPEPEPQA